jgi:hypothetical protein
MSKKYTHGYLPKIQYHALQVVEKTMHLMNDDIPDTVKANELMALNKSLDSIIHFTAKLREQYSL